MTRPLPSEIDRQLRRWSTQARLLRSIHATLGIASTLSSVLVAAKINSFTTVSLEWLAAIAAASTSLLSTFDLGSKSNRMRNAWRTLNAARIRFEVDEAMTIQGLVKVYEDAEFIIGDVKEKPA